MTIPYNAQLVSLMNYFCEGIEKKLITKEFKMGFGFLIKTIKIVIEESINIPIKDLNKHKLFKETNVLYIGEDKIDLNYWEVDTIDSTKNINGVRCWYTNVVLKYYESGNKILNTKKMRLSLSPNVIHTLDSYFLRKVVKRAYHIGVKIHTVHDEFIIAIGDYFTVLKILNDVYREIYFELNGTLLNVQEDHGFNIVI